MLTVFESFRDLFFYIASTLSLHIESTDNMVRTVFMILL